MMTRLIAIMSDYGLRLCVRPLVSVRCLNVVDPKVHSVASIFICFHLLDDASGYSVARRNVSVMASGLRVC